MSVPTVHPTVDLVADSLSEASLSTPRVADCVEDAGESIMAEVVPQATGRPVLSTPRIGGGQRLAEYSNPMFILGIDHPMVDITAVVDDDFIERYGVPIGGACLASEAQLPLYAEMCKMPNVSFSPGGTTLNSIRVAHWALGSRAGSTGYMGAVGQDRHGDYLVDTITSEGIVNSFMRTESPTANCASCLKNAERGLVTNLGAANEYRIEHLIENKEILKRAGIVYSTAFYFNCFKGESLWMAAEECRLSDNIFAFNLAAPYMIKLYKDELNDILGLTDVLFGNEVEAEAYAVENGLADRSARGVALHLASLPMRKAALRTVVITQGAHKTCLARSDGVYMEVPVPPVKRVIDTNGAGDAFVGGYLAGMSSGENLWSCLEMGHKSAGHIIQNHGCTFKGSFADL